MHTLMTALAACLLTAGFFVAAISESTGQVAAATLAAQLRHPESPAHLARAVLGGALVAANLSLSGVLRMLTFAAGAACILTTCLAEALALSLQGDRPKELNR